MFSNKVPQQKYQNHTTIQNITNVPDQGKNVRNLPIQGKCHQWSPDAEAAPVWKKNNQIFDGKIILFAPIYYKEYMESD